MDIHQLLAPSSPEGAQRERGKGQTSGKSAQGRTSPQASSKHRDSHNHNHNHNIQHGSRSSIDNTITSQQHRPSLAHRQSSIGQTELARPRLSSAQQYGSGPSSRVNPAAQYEGQLSSKSLAAVTMDEAPSRMPAPREFQSDALSEVELRQVTALLQYLGEHSYAYSTHVELINLLHKGLITHTASQAPHTYSLLPELRQAREAMDSRFAVGETLWLDWLSDEMSLAQSAEERVNVITLLQRAVDDEPASARLWNVYIDWLELNHERCHNPESTLSEEDTEVCRALFTIDLILDTLEAAARATRWRIDESASIYNRYLQAVNQHLVLQSGSEVSARRMSVQQLEQLFLDRLQDPHANVESTLQLFWPIVSQQYQDQAGDAMAGIKASIQPAREQWDLRRTHEERLQSAIDSGDQQVVLEQFNHYLKWEKVHKKRIALDKEIRAALFERALLCFPTYVELWVEYVDFIISQQPSSHNPSKSVLPLLERATKHCPWSGDLWARRILRSDYERRPYNEIEATKHRATNSGLLDVGGMEDLLKVLLEWCSYLRRQAFSATATEDNKDTAEVGITMALEDVHHAGKRLYGDAFEGDPLFRIEQIKIKFLSEARRMEDARNVYRSLVPRMKNSADFWIKYHVWEITLWIIDRVNEAERVETTETGPQLATAIVEQALAQQNLDWPEKVADMYVDHYQWHESVEKVQAATLNVTEFRRKIARKRAKEAEALAQQQQEEQQEQLAVFEAESLKRKRDDDLDEEVDAPKKAKIETTNGDDAHQKRDRENLSVTLTGLAPETTDKDIRLFFKGCGEILSIEIAPPVGQTTSATVEFGEKSDKDYAKSRSGRTLLDREVEVHSGSHSTLYVTNYPAAYDEQAVRDLFSSYGEITSVRFPSLKFNSRRRFCYVQFVSHQQAKAAEASMDGKRLDNIHQLVAKISDPNAKNQRSGAQAELRELFVKNIDVSTTEEEVQALFEEYGTVQSVKLLKNVSGKRIGSGFVVFSTAEEAKAALEKANNRPVKDRVLQVSLSTPKGGTAPSVHAARQDIIVKHDDEQTSQRRGSDVSMVSAQSQDVDSAKTVRERQVALFGVPSTVADARIVAEMEKHGRVNKVQLRREKDAAIVEFDDIKTAFKVRVGMDFEALGPECRSGDVQDLFGKPKKNVTFKPNVVSRPAQRGARRGGLGFKRGAFTNGSASSEKSEVKSNADFKAMFLKGKEAEEET